MTKRRRHQELPDPATANPPLAAHKHWLRSKWTIGLAIVLLTYTLAGFFLVPALIKWQMLKRLPPLAHRMAAVRQVRFNPYALSLTIRGFALTETNGEEFASFEEFYVNFQLISVIKRGFVFKEITLRKPSASIVYLANGNLNVSNLLPTNAPPSPPAPPPSASRQKNGPQLPFVFVEQLTIEGGGLSFTDLHHPTPFRQRFGPINIRVNNFTTRPREGSPYSIMATSDAGATFSWAGDVSVNPPHSTGLFQLSGLPLTKYAPYIQDLIHANLTGGRVDFHTDYHFDMTNDAVSLSISNAELGLTNLEVGITEPKPLRATVENLRLAVSGISFDAGAKRAEIAEIRLSDLKAVATLLPGQTSNAVTTVPTADATITVPTTKPMTAAPQQTTNAFQVKVGAVVFENTSFRFVDESIEPHATTGIDQLNGSIKGLTSELDTAAAVDFNGKVNGFAPFSISGQLNPLAKDLFVDLSILFRDVGLTTISPYLAKYAGYPLQKGTLTLDLHYSVAQRALNAKNNVRVDQLALGASSGSPDATKLPVKLAIALLQDRHGVIALDVPVSGRLDDPKFKLGPLIWQVFMNVITKAVTKPFALLGSMFGGGEDLSFIACEPGQADFAVGELNKLDALATALYERPALHLQIVGAVDPANDRDALKLTRLKEQLAAPNGKNAAAAALQLSPQEYEHRLKEAYSILFHKVQAAARVAAAPAVHSNVQKSFAREPSAPDKKAVQPAAPNAPLPESLKPVEQVTRAEMEQALIPGIEITSADFNVLMQARADKVRDYLLQTGKAAADRLTVAAPKPVDASYKGESRVNLSLE